MSKKKSKKNPSWTKRSFYAAIVIAEVTFSLMIFLANKNSVGIKSNEISGDAIAEQTVDIGSNEFSAENTGDVQIVDSPNAFANTGVYVSQVPEPNVSLTEISVSKFMAEYIGKYETSYTNVYVSEYLFDLNSIYSLDTLVLVANSPSALEISISNPRTGVLFGYSEGTLDETISSATSLRLGAPFVKIADARGIYRVTYVTQQKETPNIVYFFD